VVPNFFDNQSAGVPPNTSTTTINLPGTFNQQVTTTAKPDPRKNANGLTQSSSGTSGDKKSQVAIDLENIFKQLQKQQSTGTTKKVGPSASEGYTSGEDANGKTSKSKGKKNFHSSDEEDDGGEDFFKTNQGSSLKSLRKAVPCSTTP
jgi:hypothetical protein